jgi:hypothetical protein
MAAQSGEYCPPRFCQALAMLLKMCSQLSIHNANIA